MGDLVVIVALCSDSSNCCLYKRSVSVMSAQGLLYRSEGEFVVTEFWKITQFTIICVYHFHTSDQRKVSAYISHITLAQEF